MTTHFRRAEDGFLLIFRGEIRRGCRSASPGIKVNPLQEQFLCEPLFARSGTNDVGAGSAVGVSESPTRALRWAEATSDSTATRKTM